MAAKRPIKIKLTFRGRRVSVEQNKRGDLRFKCPACGGPVTLEPAQYRTGAGDKIRTLKPAYCDGQDCRYAFEIVHSCVMTYETPIGDCWNRLKTYHHESLHKVWKTRKQGRKHERRRRSP